MRIAAIACSIFSFAALATPDCGRAGGTSHVAEIVTFRLIDGTAVTDFTGAAKRMTRFLLGTGSVRSRTLSTDEDGTWTDHIVWTSMTAAKAAAETAMQDPNFAGFFSLIYPASVEMRHEVIHLLLSPE